jgi:putative membrane protein
VPDSPTQRIPAESMRYIVRTPGPQPSPKAEVLHRPLFIAFLVVFGAAWLMLVFGFQLPIGWQWTEGLVFVFAAATSLMELARRLPTQNVVSVGLVLAGLGAMGAMVGAKTHLPFGHFEFTEAFGPKLLGLLVWPVPFIWIVVVLNCRGVAKHILRPWRRDRRYGMWLIGLSALLALLLDFALEPFAVQVKRWWTWKAVVLPVEWYGAPWSNFVAWLALTGAYVAFATPWLVLKRPLPHAPDFHPLIMWLALHVLFATGSALRGLWAPVALSAIVSVVVGVLAWRGETQPPPPPPPRPGMAPGPGPGSAPEPGQGRPAAK